MRHNWAPNLAVRGLILRSLSPLKRFMLWVVTKQAAFS